jgi:hypothetical protein
MLDLLGHEWLKLVDPGGLRLREMRKASSS